MLTTRLHQLRERISHGVRAAVEAPRAAQLSLAAVVFGLAGTLGAVRELPTDLLAVLVGLFVLVAPGALALSWYPGLPLFALAALLPAVSIAISLVAVTALLLLNVYSPALTLVALSSLTAAGGLARWVQISRRRQARAGATP